MKKKALIIFKAQWDWNKFIINKISKFYETEYLYLDKIKKNYLDTISEINNLVEEKKIETVFFDVDYQKFINLFFIDKIKNVKKVMMTFDNYERHNINMITACSCHAVMSDSISVLKYKEIGIPAYTWFLESDGSFYKDLKLKKDIDVLFFGKINKDRKNFMSFIEENGIKTKIVGNNMENRISDEQLVSLICKSKIVVNFSKTTWGKIRNFPETDVFRDQYQLKGRIVQAGLCGTACVTEYAPQHSLLYKDDELLQFNTKEECVEILKNLLNNSEKLLGYSKKFSDKTRNYYEDSKTFKKVYDFLEKMDTAKINQKSNILKQVPYWYMRTCAKQILLRDLKLSKIFKSAIQFKEIFSVVKGSNLFTKVLIFVESALNFLYYSLLNTIKIKSAGKNRYTDEL